MLIFIAFSFFVFAAYALLIIYYHRAWNDIPIHQTSALEIVRTKISVIVPARNEEKNIARCLDSLINQTYSRDCLEIIVVDDHSTDHTWKILSELASRNQRIVPVKLSDYDKGAATVAFKKLAIETGIQVSTGDLIVTTDADCSFDPLWLQSIATFYHSTQACFIAAPVKIATTNSLLSVFQTLDFITLQGITGAAVFRRLHSMCNGANLAYEKSVFTEVDGFRGIDHIPSGDDMLLMHKILRKYPHRVLFLKDKNAIVFTLPETTWMGFFNQRIRWASKAGRYDDKRISWILALVYLVNLVFLSLFIAACWNRVFFFTGLGLLILKTVVEYPFVRVVARFFDQEKLMPYFPLLQPLHILYSLVAGWLGRFGSYRWKERDIG